MSAAAANCGTASADSKSSAAVGVVTGTASGEQLTANGLASVKAVYQTNHTPTEGNALQACVASIFNRELQAVPNFITAAGGDYLGAINQWLVGHAMSAVKFTLATTDKERSAAAAASTASDSSSRRRVVGVLPYAMVCGSLCVMAGKSVRGTHRHCVVGVVTPDPAAPTTQCSSRYLAVAHDPFQTATHTNATAAIATANTTSSDALDGLADWCLFIAASQPRVFSLPPPPPPAAANK